MTYHLHSIFSSLQGEGRNSGLPATFVRFSSCNLACPWCDAKKSDKMQLTADETVRRVAEYRNRWVIVTGGEPTIQPELNALLEALRADGRRLALETNGVVAPTRPELFDYVSVSPKSGYALRYGPNSLKRADEVRIVAESTEIVPFCRRMRETIAATDYYVSPLEKDGKIHYHRAMSLLEKLNRLVPEATPPWKLSIQQQKILGIR